MHINRPQTKNSLFSSPLVVAGLVIVAFFLTLSAVRILIRAYTIRVEEKELEATRVALEEKKRNLEIALEHSNSPETVERIAKEKLNLKNSGEQVVVVKNEVASTTPEKRFFNHIIPNWLSRLFGF